MDVWTFWKEENEEVRERYELSMERIRQIPQEKTVVEPFKEYFISMARFVGMIGELVQELQEGKDREMSLEELQQENFRLYQDILPENYEASYGNPAWASVKLGEEFGPLLSFL